MMNIYCLDENPIKCAQYHRDADLSKMIAISTKILEEVQFGIRHPKPNKCVIWAATTSGNYEWLFNMTAQLCMEFEKAFGFTHPAFDKISTVLRNTPATIPVRPRSSFPTHMPEEFTTSLDGKKRTPVEAHRLHYKTIGAYDLTYKTRPRPTWL